MLHISPPSPRPRAASEPIGHIGHVTPMPHDRDQRTRDQRVNERRERRHPQQEQKRQSPQDTEHKIDDYA